MLPDGCLFLFLFYLIGVTDGHKFEHIANHVLTAGLFVLERLIKVLPKTVGCLRPRQGGPALYQAST